jgi:hypothetical protein
MMQLVQNLQQQQQREQQQQSQLLQLPLELLVAIMKWLPQGQRLGSGLVCRSFNIAAAAAAAATQKIDCIVRLPHHMRQHRTASLYKYLQKHRNIILTHMGVAVPVGLAYSDGWPGVQLAQPCLPLQSLSLSYVLLGDAVQLYDVHDDDGINSFSLQEGQQPHGPSACPVVAPVIHIAALIELTSLKLFQVRVRSPTHIHSWTASQLSSLTCLQCLQLHYPRATDD